MGCNKILSQEEVVRRRKDYGGCPEVEASHAAALAELERLRNPVKYRREMQGIIDARDEEIAELKKVVHSHLISREELIKKVSGRGMTIDRYQHLEDVLRDSISDLKREVTRVERVMMELGAPKKGSLIEGCWDTECVNPYKAVATGERVPILGVKGLCNGASYIFKYWRYLGDSAWEEGWGI